jgi:DNA polymerase-3 subunit delta'
VSWKDIVGHESQIKYLIQAWKTNRLGQAYFFHGPDGIGKRTLAIELGKALLCQSNSNFEACGVCASCKLVEASNHPDLQTNGCPKDVHEFPRELMKEICEGFFLKASRGGAKVLVIDDCDLLNEESGNIFLKSLEEPPPYSIIFLIGTSLERQLETILSRCQKLAFHGLSPSEVAKVFAINQIEGSFDLNKITGACGGSVSQAIMLTDPEFSQLEDSFFAEIITPAPDPVKLVKMVMDFIEGAGKETSAQRGRARWLVHGTLGWIRGQILLKSNTVALISRPRFQLPAAVPIEKVLAMLEACFQAEYQIQRRVQLSLTIQWWVDGLIWADSVTAFDFNSGAF